MKPVYGRTNLAPGKEEVQRFGSVTGLKPDMEHRYRELHANAWESVTRRLTDSNVRNYSIFVTELAGQKYLFSYFEYIGADFDADMQAIANDPQTQRWWKETDPCQRPLPSSTEGAMWSDMERVFFLP